MAELQTANVAYCQRKIQLSVFSAYPDGSPSQLIRISGVLLYFFPQPVQIGSGFHATSYCIGTKKLPRGVKAVRREAEHISV